MGVPGGEGFDGACTVTAEPFDRIEAYLSARSMIPEPDAPFLLPAWQKAWIRHFGQELAVRLCVVRHDTVPIGMAGLGFDGNRARLLGSPDVCDYLDCLVAAGREQAFFRVLFDYLRSSGIAEFDAGHVRARSRLMRSGVPVARSLGLSVVCQREEITFSRELPGSFEEYLEMLSGKQRHEARRKLRKFSSAGAAVYHPYGQGAKPGEALGVFLRLFRESRSDKDAFLTPAREAFFLDIAGELSRSGLLHLGILTLDERPVAAVFCCDYNRTRFLYNSGYDLRYRGLSAGLVCKLLSIKDAIARGFERYDFLKGAEPYKQHLGGESEPVYRCRIMMG